MEYEITYTLQREATVIVDIDDEKLNSEFEMLGEITSDEDFKKEFDPRWEIEEIAYSAFSSGGKNVSDDMDNEAVVNRSIKRVFE